MQERARNRRLLIGRLAAAAAIVVGAVTVAVVTAVGTGASSGRLPLRLVADLALPGPASRFDYQSADAKRRLLFVAHLAAGQIVEVDLQRRRVAATIPAPGVHGVLVAPSLRRLYASASDAHELVTLDERSGRVVGKALAGILPDGIAYDPVDQETFVSDEVNDQVSAFDARSGRLVARTHLPGDAGNVQYDAGSGRVLVDVGERNEVAAIDPRSHRIVRFLPLPGCEHDHGLHLDVPGRLAFVACDGNAKLLVLDLRSGRVTQTESVGSNPDVLDLDPALHRLYVAAESGVVAVFAEQGRRLAKLGQGFLATEAHSVAVDPRTHLVYFPLQDVNGRPVLRIMRPTRR